jgi:hypothetical protein
MVINVKVSKSNQVAAIIARRRYLCQRKNGREAARPSFLLAQRARSEGARWTRAVKDNLAAPLESEVGENEKSGRGPVGLLCSRNAQPEKDRKGSLVVLLLAERAR